MNWGLILGIGGLALMLLAVVAVGSWAFFGRGSDGEGGGGGDGGGNPPPRSVDLAYVPADCSLAVVIHPQRFLPSPLWDPLRKDDKLLDDLTKQYGIDPRKVDQVVLLLDPVAEEKLAHTTGYIIRPSEPADAKELLARVLPEAKTADFEGKTYHTLASKRFGGTLAGYAADERTLLLAPEPVLKKMLGDKSPKSPLRDRLALADLGHDLLAVYALDETDPPRLGKTTRQGLADLLKPYVKDAESLDPEKLPFQVRSATLTLDLSGDTFARLEVEVVDEKAAEQVEKSAKAAIDLARDKGRRKTWFKRVPKDLVGPLGAALDERCDDIIVRRDGARVSLSVKPPTNLGDLLVKAAPLLRDKKGEGEPRPGRRRDDDGRDSTTGPG